MQKAVYTAIKTQILTYATAVKHVGLWNNQVEYWRMQENPEYAVRFPAVFIELPTEVNGDVIGDNKQIFDPYDIKIHIVSVKLNSYESGDVMEENWEPFDLKTAVYKALQLFRFTGSGPMNRITEGADNDHDNIYHFLQIYRTTWLDLSVLPKKEVTEVDPPFTWDNNVDYPN